MDECDWTYSGCGQRAAQAHTEEAEEYRDRMEERSGMGSEPRGPSFSPWYASQTPPATPVRADQDTPADGVDRSPSSAAYRPRAARWSALITVAAVVLVGLVVAVSTVVAVREDSRPTAAKVVAPVSAAPVRTDRMEFATADADGVLIIARRLWSPSGVRPPAFGSYLHVEVQIVCRNGTLSYGPEHFSAFDAAGKLFEVSSGGRWGTPLGYGILLAGDSVSGTIAFDLPRGEVTLLMSDDSSQSVTAVKIPD